jgi:hypothetical protein
MSQHGEETLDPDDWDALRTLGRQMVDHMLNRLQSVRDRPAWQAVPESAKAAIGGGSSTP